MNLYFLLISIGLFIFIILIMSVFSLSNVLSPVFFVGRFFGLFFNNSIVFYNYGSLSIVSLKFLSVFSLFSFYFYLSFGCPNIYIVLFNWLENYGFLGNFSFVFDFYSVVFFLVASYVTWSIVEFSYYYMSSDPRWFSFFRLLMVFLLNMLLLVSSNNLFFVFVGWEGVGFLSFLLISWWNTRNDANSSALEAVIYNRVGDVGFLVLLSLCFIYFNTWSLLDISFFLLNNIDFWLVHSFLFSVLLASMAKSAQIGFHPWLPAAMEGPTPVSALLHSSTMVVAGVFFLIRIGTLIDFSGFFCSCCLFVGGVTSLFAASAALVQHDIKKIIAYSTTSQLGLMVVSVGLGNCIISFFHVCTHAFFKAMLFLCSGSVIHSLNNEQDLRKMGGLFNFLPITSSCIFLGSLALIGTPFLSGFYSKDLILELSFLSFSNFLGVFFAFLSSLFTVIYSFRIIFFCFLYPMLGSSLCNINEESFNLVFSIFRLGVGTIFCGWFFCGYVFPSVVFILPFSLKSLSLFLIFFGMLFSFCFYLSYNGFFTYFFLYWFLSFQWFFLVFFHYFFSFFYFFLSLYGGSRLLDRGWYENLGPQGSGYLITYSSSSSQYFYGGYIKYYLFFSFLTSVFIFTLLVFF
uniref:NADH-ubiquinone oxidoreductase chain 5 n=1 Tax=Phanogenia gracilis TaxID=329963 RepID=Q2QJD3_9ECHI|nr:NADH dehydrogenase subunit 5 [Phanogenia gracilis]AAY51833.1 NADH dehydrogenase subunit 5 [Phanogenia gracilis]